jgi:hypothetical protein
MFPSELSEYCHRVLRNRLEFGCWSLRTLYVASDAVCQGPFCCFFVFNPLQAVLGFKFYRWCFGCGAFVQVHWLNCCFGLFSSTCSDVVDSWWPLRGQEISRDLKGRAWSVSGYWTPVLPLCVRECTGFPGDLHGGSPRSSVNYLLSFTAAADGRRSCSYSILLSIYDRVWFCTLPGA